MASSKSVLPDILNVYTDGSCLLNGKPNASAAIGVHISECPEMNISERVGTMLPQTSEMAEILAVFKALELCRGRKQATIYTDSEQCVTYLDTPSLQRSEVGWKVSDGCRSSNLSTVRAIVGLMKELRSHGVKINIVKVKAHSGDKGNVRADKLARKAAKRESGRHPPATLNMLKYIEKMEGADSLEELHKEYRATSCSTPDTFYSLSDDEDELPQTREKNSMDSMIDKFQSLSSRLNIVALELTEISRELINAKGEKCKF